MKYRGKGREGSRVKGARKRVARTKDENLKEGRPGKLDV